MQYNGAARPVFCVGEPPFTPWVLAKAPKCVERSKIRMLEAFCSLQGWTGPNKDIGVATPHLDLRCTNGMGKYSNLSNRSNHIQNYPPDEQPP
mgnify:CR=1 FL=1